jgi:hypothetical protein
MGETFFKKILFKEEVQEKLYGLKKKYSKPNNG